MTTNPDYDSILAVIRYHVWWPGANDPYWLYNQTENRARCNYYQPNNAYAPRAFIDGNFDGGSSYGGWTARVNSESLIDADAAILLSGDYNPDTDSGHITVTIITETTPDLTNLKLRIALVESGIYYNAPYGPDIHNQTFRDMIPSTTGQSVTLTEGDTLEYTFDFRTPSPIVAENCMLYAYVQSDQTTSPAHRIVQVAKINVSTLSPNGIGDNTIPSTFTLNQNYPNPFNGKTEIGFNTKGGNVSLEVFDITGSLVSTLVNGSLEAGHHSVIWNGLNNSGKSAASGVYFYRLQDNSGSQVRRMMLLK